MNYSELVDKLLKGHTVQFRPHGNSMTPKIQSGQLVTIVPVTDVAKGDVVLCKAIIMSTWCRQYRAKDARLAIITGMLMAGLAGIVFLAKLIKLRIDNACRDGLQALKHEEWTLWTVAPV